MVAQVCNADGTLCFPATTPSPVSAAASKPRVILNVLMDDADYQDFGYFSADAVTPNIDSIAHQGVILSRFYSAGPVCSPTRASILSGHEPAYFGLSYLWEEVRHIVQNGQYWTGMRGLPDGEATLAQMLHDQGYATMHIGKWHIGDAADRFLPKAKGFDTYEIPDPYPYSGSMRVRTETGDKTVTSDWLPKYEADRIISYIDTNLASGRNIFINWWPYEPHILIANNQQFYYVPPTFNRAAFDAAATGKLPLDLTTDRGKLLSMMFAFDEQFGRVIQHLKDKGVFDDSLVIETSDNGGHVTALSPKRMLIGNKGTLYEGGIRVPFAASWPKRFTAGTHSSLPVASTDLFPTIAGLIGAPKPSGIEGVDVSSVLLNGTGSHPPMFFWLRKAAYRRSTDDKYDDSFAVIDGCDKLFLDNGNAAYWNVCADPSERNQLTKANPARVTQLKALLLQKRLADAQYVSFANLTSPQVFSSDDRLDIHGDDLSVYATVNVTGSKGTGLHTLYQRGDGINVTLKDGTLSAAITGIADRTASPSMKTVTLSAPVPQDGRSHRIGFVIRGYFDGGSTLRLFIDGQIVGQAAAALSTQYDIGTSVYAVKSDQVKVQIGDNTLPFTNVQVYVNAIEPGEF
ncbi:MAG: sulfatase-like hydrolase/transferase [Sphingomonadales bacterium]|nr:sulfatase-like hydrolase/transferase [Sphingomonadales bacterium]MDE2570529.1 sulfatase-like hydrolase/transferase [Sphingomonadales bacterium]